MEKRRGQLSLEFMFVFTLMLIMLLYSVRTVGFDSPASSGTLALQIALEEKSVANVIAGAIDQVYAQGPGSKVTVYARFNLLRNPNYISKAFNLTSPQVLIMLIGTTDPLFPPGAENSVVAVAVFGDYGPILTGSNRTGVWVQTIYPYDGSSLVQLEPTEVPSLMKIVVEWNPSEPVSMTYDNGTLHINVRAGG